MEYRNTIVVMTNLVMNERMNEGGPQQQQEAEHKENRGRRAA